MGFSVYSSPRRFLACRLLGLLAFLALFSGVAAASVDWSQTSSVSISGIQYNVESSDVTETVFYRNDFGPGVSDVYRWRFRASGVAQGFRNDELLYSATYFWDGEKIVLVAADGSFPGFVTVGGFVYVAPTDGGGSGGASVDLTPLVESQARLQEGIALLCGITLSVAAFRFLV